MKPGYAGRRFALVRDVPYNDPLLTHLVVKRNVNIAIDGDAMRVSARVHGDAQAYLDDIQVILYCNGYIRLYPIAYDAGWPGLNEKSALEKTAEPITMF